MNAYKIIPIAQNGANIHSYDGPYFSDEIPEDTEFWQYVATPVVITLANKAADVADKIYQKRAGRKAANLRVSLLVDGSVKISGGEGKIFKYSGEEWPVIYMEGNEAEVIGLIEVKV